MAHLDLCLILRWNCGRNVANLALLHRTGEQLRGDLVAQRTLQCALLRHTFIQAPVNPRIAHLLLEVWVEL